MIVKRLPRDVAVVPVQCQHNVKLVSNWDYTWRLQRYGDGRRCTRNAFYDVNGDKLCAQHAGEIAVAILLKLSSSNEAFMKWFEESQA